MKKIKPEIGILTLFILGELLTFGFILLLSDFIHLYFYIIHLYNFVGMPLMSS